MMTIEVNENSVFQQNKSLYKILQKRKQQKRVDESEYIIMGNYARLKGSMMRLLSQCYPGSNMQYHAYVPYTVDKTISIMPILKLMEMVDLASYDLKGEKTQRYFYVLMIQKKLKDWHTQDIRMMFCKRLRESTVIVKNYCDDFLCAK